MGQFRVFAAAEGRTVVDMIMTDPASFQLPDHQSPFRLVELNRV